jgi:hypothetical protein
MSTYPIHDDAEPLPHTTMLEYLRLSTSTPQDKDTAPPPYTYNTTLHPHGVGVGEESCCGFWSGAEPSSDSDNIRACYATFYATCYASFAFSFTIIACIGYLIALVFAMELVAAQFGSDMGFVKWVANRGNTHYDASITITFTRRIANEMKLQMRFCLESVNRQVPGPQVWRYITKDGVAECTTELLTLSAGSSDVWKMRFGDETIFGEELWRKKVEERVDADDLGDDLAREGGGRAFDVDLGKSGQN